MAHAPVLMQASGNMAMALRNKTKLARSTAELAILRAAQVVDCDYVWGRHVSLARAAGVSGQQLEQIAGLAGQRRIYARRKGSRSALLRRSPAARKSMTKLLPQYDANSRSRRLSN